MKEIISQPQELPEPYAVTRGSGPIVATAIHAGNRVRREVAELLAISELDRLREEDPYTDLWTDVVPNSVVVTRSRFEIDINRAKETALYLKSEDSWGLQVWKREPPADLVARSHAIHESFYAHMKELLGSIQRDHGRFVVFDLHSYNHRRAGPQANADDPELNPEVNVGTISMDRDHWAPIVDRFMEALRDFDYRGRRLDVRENVRFQGRGELARFVHDTFPETGCCLAIELKKFYMDEWTGEAYAAEVQDIRSALASTIPPLMARLAEM